MVEANIASFFLFFEHYLHLKLAIFGMLCYKRIILLNDYIVIQLSLITKK